MDAENDIADEGAEALAAVLRRNTSLTMLRVRCKYMNAVSAWTVLVMLSGNACVVVYYREWHWC